MTDNLKTRDVLFKETEPNEGLMLEVSSESGFALADLLVDPIDFMDKQGAFGFTKGWAHEKTEQVGGNNEKIKTLTRIKIFNQNKLSRQTWFLIEADVDVTHLELVGQIYEILKNVDGFNK